MHCRWVRYFPQPLEQGVGLGFEYEHAMFCPFVHAMLKRETVDEIFFWFYGKRIRTYKVILCLFLIKGFLDKWCSVSCLTFNLSCTQPKMSIFYNCNQHLKARSSNCKCAPWYTIVRKGNNTRVTDTGFEGVQIQWHIIDAL